MVRVIACYLESVITSVNHSELPHPFSKNLQLEIDSGKGNQLLSFPLVLFRTRDPVQPPETPLRGLFPSLVTQLHVVRYSNLLVPPGLPLTEVFGPSSYTGLHRPLPLRDLRKKLTSCLTTFMNPIQPKVT